jgi:hypothetical protein
MHTGRHVVTQPFTTTTAPIIIQQQPIAIAILQLLLVLLPLFRRVANTATIVNIYPAKMSVHCTLAARSSDLFMQQLALVEEHKVFNPFDRRSVEKQLQKERALLAICGCVKKDTWYQHELNIFSFSK